MPSKHRSGTFCEVFSPFFFFLPSFIWLVFSDLYSVVLQLSLRKVAFRAYIQSHWIDTVCYKGPFTCLQAVEKYPLCVGVGWGKRRHTGTGQEGTVYGQLRTGRERQVFACGLPINCGSFLSQLILSVYLCLSLSSPSVRLHWKDLSDWLGVIN